jgi:hypothetical protein
MVSALDGFGNGEEGVPTAVAHGVIDHLKAVRIHEYNADKFFIPFGENKNHLLIKEILSIGG